VCAEAEQEKKSREVKLNNVTRGIFFLRLYFKEGAGENFPCRDRGPASPPYLRHCVCDPSRLQHKVWWHTQGRKKI